MAISEVDFDISQLQATTYTFHLLHHRNRNQHRHSKWWKWFSLLKRCVSKLVHEIRTRDSLRVQARLKHMNQVLLPRCYSSFTQLIQDSQFSTLGLTLIAELSRIRSLVAPRSSRADNKVGPTEEFVDSRNTFSLNLSEDIGESLKRTTSSNPTDVGASPILAFGIITGLERRGAGLDGAILASNETQFPRPKAGMPIAGLQSYASSAPVERQKQSKSSNAIDDLFKGLD